MYMTLYWPLKDQRKTHSIRRPQTNSIKTWLHWTTITEQQISDGKQEDLSEDHRKHFRSTGRQGITGKGKPDLPAFRIRRDCCGDNKDWSKTQLKSEHSWLIHKLHLPSQKAQEGGFSLPHTQPGWMQTISWIPGPKSWARTRSFSDDGAGRQPTPPAPLCHSPE